MVGCGWLRPLASREEVQRHENRGALSVGGGGGLGFRV